MAGRKRSISPQKGNKNNPITIPDSSTRLTRSSSVTSQNDVTMGQRDVTTPRRDGTTPPRDVTTPRRDVIPQEESGVGFSARKMFRKSRSPTSENVTSSGSGVTSQGTGNTAEQTRWSWGPERVKVKKAAQNTIGNKAVPSSSGVKRPSTSSSTAGGFSARSLLPSASQKSCVKLSDVQPSYQTSVTSNRRSPSAVNSVNRDVSRRDKKTLEPTKWSWGPERVQQKQSGKASSIPIPSTSRTDTTSRPCGLSSVRNNDRRSTPGDSSASDHLASTQAAVKRKSNILPKSRVEFTPSSIEGRVFAVAKRRSGGITENSQDSKLCGMIQSRIPGQKSALNPATGHTDDGESPSKIAKFCNAKAKAKTGCTTSSSGSRTGITGSSSNSSVGGQRRNPLLKKPSLLGSKPSLLGFGPGSRGQRKVESGTLMPRIPLISSGGRPGTSGQNRPLPEPRPNFQNKNSQRNANTANLEKQAIKSTCPSNHGPHKSTSNSKIAATPPRCGVQKFSPSSPGRDTGIADNLTRAKRSAADSGLNQKTGKVTDYRSPQPDRASAATSTTPTNTTTSISSKTDNKDQGLFRYASKVPSERSDLLKETSSEPGKSAEGRVGLGAETSRDGADSAAVTESMSVSVLTDKGEVVTVRQSCSQEVMEWADEEESRWISQNQQFTSPMVSKVRREDDVCGMDLDYDDESSIPDEDSSRDARDPRDSREPRVVYVVCDTCVMSPRVIEHIRDLKLNNGATVCIVIPWVVMQELDVMKDNKRSQFSSNRQTKAQRGVKAIHSWLTDRHPRVQAQTAQRDSEPLPGLTEEVNDDRVLKCCLQYAREVGPVVLYTEDINLSNKALISGITPHNSQTIVKELLKIQLPSPGRSSKVIPRKEAKAPNSQWPKKWSPQEEKREIEEALVPTSPVLPPDPDRRALIDGILVDLKQIMYTVLAPYLEKEMRNEYRDLYLDVIKIKPPWTTVDVLENLDKHWIAVFGDLIGRQHQADVRTLLEALKPGSDVTNGRDDVTELLKSAVALVEALVGKASTAVTNLPAVLKLQERWRRAKHSLNQSQPSPAHRVTTPTRTRANQRPSQSTPTTSSANRRNYQNCDTNRNFSSPTMTNVNEQCQPKPIQSPKDNQIDNRRFVDAENAVMTKFQYLWNSMNNMVREISCVLESGSVPRQTVESRVRALTPVLSLLRDIYHSALARREQQDIHLLAQALNELSASLQLPQNQPEDVPISADQLALVCASQEKRPLLENGLVQLQSFLKDLQAAHFISFSPRTFS